MIKTGLFSFFLFAAVTLLVGQGSNLPLGNEAYHILDRLEIKTALPFPYHSSLKYYTRGDITRCALAVDTAHVALNSSDRRDLYYIFKDNNEWLGTAAYATTLGGKRERLFPDTTLSQVEASMEDSRYILSKKPFLKIFYRSPANFLEVNQKYFHLRLNPILNVKLANAKDDSELIFKNQRGVELRAGIDDRIYLYFNILETQERFPDYVNRRIQRDKAIPGAGLFKEYKSQLFNIENGYDYLNSQGYLAFNISRHVGLQFGYGRNFIGNGYRSMLLSDFSNNYLYLKLNWTFWKFHYQNIFAELSLQSANGTPNTQLVPKKYMTAHHFSINITPNINLGLFEVVIFSRNQQFELQYLNPIILYRTIEQSLGSPDNVLLGFDGKWNFLRRFQFYGQVLFDEFVFNEIFVEKRGWWGNKFGVQSGLKYIDAFGVDHLDLQAEYNSARPYTYSGRDSLVSFVHYNQPLAHPLGANFREFLLRLRYQPLKRLIIDARLINARFGEDGPDENWGGNPLKPNTTREQTYGNETTQGIFAKTTLFGLDVTYVLAHNVFLDLQYFSRKKDSENDGLDSNTQYFGGGIRINIAKQRMDF